jgi:hypothetical protein
VLVLKASRRPTGVDSFVREVRQTVIAVCVVAKFLQRTSVK